MPVTDPLQMCVRIERGVSPVSGCVVLGHSSTRVFIGWTELFAVLETAVADDNTKGEAGAAQDL
jgi:hypothetical protein